MANMDDSKNPEILELRRIVGREFDLAMARKIDSLLLDVFFNGITNDDTIFPPSARIVTPSAFPRGLHIPTRGTT